MPAMFAVTPTVTQELRAREERIAEMERMSRAFACLEHGAPTERPSRCASPVQARVTVRNRL